MTELRISAGLPQYVPDEPADVLTRFAVRAEALGLAGLWTVDSVPGAATAAGPVIEGLHALTAAGAVTSTIRLGVSVIVLPARNPLWLARELASIDLLSGGRLTVGIGIGRENADGIGLPQGRRALRLREGLEVMRAVWAGDGVSHEGELYRFEDLSLGPKPAQRPGPPVWFGAGTPPALQRAARLGDGWMGAGSSSSQAFGEQVAILREALEAEGRDPAGFSIAKRVYLGVEDSDAQALARLAPRLDSFYSAPGMTERVAICGTAEACAERLRELVDAGAEELLLNPAYDYMDQLEALATVGDLVRRG